MATESTVEQQVSIKTLSNTVIKINFDFSRTFGELKELIQNDDDLCTSNNLKGKTIRLIYKGKVLVDHQTPEGIGYVSSTSIVMMSTKKFTLANGNELQQVTPASAPAPEPAPTPTGVDSMASFANIMHMLQNGQAPPGVDLTQLTEALQNPQMIQNIFLNMMSEQITTPGPVRDQVRNGLIHANPIIRVLSETMPDTLEQILTNNDFVHKLVTTGILRMPGPFGQLFGGSGGGDGEGDGSGGGGGGGGDDGYDESKYAPGDATDANRQDVDNLCTMGFERIMVVQIYYGPAERNADRAATMLFEMN